MAAVQCPRNAFQYNVSLCACNPGYLFNSTARSCQLFEQPEAVLVADSQVNYSLTFPETIFSFDSIKKFTQSQAVFLEATAIMLASWLVFCFLLRFGSLGDGRTLWFKIRWWISRLDVCFASRHWLDDQKVVLKRKTELGGTFSIASGILFIGLFAALLYQILSKRTVEVHNVRATNAPDLDSFINDLEFKITTISSMTCSHLRGLGTLVTGNPGFIDLRTTPLSSFVNYSCQNTTKGPNIILRCNDCRLIRDNSYISWQYVDLPNDPATAVGFDFNLTARNKANRNHLSFVSGTLKYASQHGKKPISYRGPDPNILKFNFFPRIYHNMYDLKLIQPLFHEFLAGSSFDETSHFRASIESSNNGLINITLYINFLSAYIVESDNQNILGPVSFLADLGGLYCFSVGIFFYILLQCEYRIKKVRNEDNVFRRIRRQRKAQERWDKLRKYVMYTWGSSLLDDDNKNVKEDTCCSGVTVDSFGRSGSLHRRRQESTMDTISFSRKVNLPSRKVLDNEVLKYGKDEHAISLHEGDHIPTQTFPSVYSSLPSPPVLEFSAGSEMSMGDIQKNLKSLYDYNVTLREELVAAEAKLHALAKNESSLTHHT